MLSLTLRFSRIVPLRSIALKILKCCLSAIFSRMNDVQLVRLHLYLKLLRRLDNRLRSSPAADYTSVLYSWMRANWSAVYPARFLYTQFAFLTLVMSLAKLIAS